MAFVGQGAKQSVLPYFIVEHDCANRSSKASSSIVEKPFFHEDITVQVRAPVCLSKGSAVEPTLHSSDSPAIPHWMRSKQVQNILVNTSAKSGLKTNVVPSTPMPQLLQQNSQVPETLGSFCTLPSPRLALGSEGQANTRNGAQSRPDTPNSNHLFQQQLPARSPLSVGLSPSQGFKRDEQREEPKISKKDLLSLLLHKQEKQSATDLSLGQSAGKPLHQIADVGSWISKFPFQISPTLEEAGERHSSQLGEPLGHQMVSELNSECLTQGACTGVLNVPSQLVGSNAQVNHSKYLTQHSPPSLTRAANYLHSQRTIPSLANSSLKSPPWLLPETLTGSHAPSLKRDWNATLVQCVKNPQLLPDFFAQQKVISSTKADQCPRTSENPEMKPTVFFSQKGLASRVDEENARLNMHSLNGAFCSDRIQNSFLNQQSFKQQDLGCGRELMVSRDSPSTQGLGMPSIASGCVPLFTDSASTQGLGMSSTVSAFVPSLPFMKQSQRGTTVLANKYAQIVGDWGEFLAAPSIGQTAETDAKTMLPFQQRFMQLQKFLKKCDEDNCLQALRSLSTTARNEHAAELESRALKLSVEEGKEMKRAKLIHVLEESLDGTHMNPCKRPMGPWFSAPGAATVVREEA
eukprot:c9577_g1_i2 orf=1086-2987(+)